jgi:hypothetical protein
MEALVLLVILATSDMSVKSAAVKAAQECEAQKAQAAEGETRICARFDYQTPLGWVDAKAAPPPFDREVEVYARASKGGLTIPWRGMVKFHVQPGEGEWEPKWLYLPKDMTITHWRERTPGPTIR